MGWRSQARFIISLFCFLRFKFSGGKYARTWHGNIPSLIFLKPPGGFAAVTALSVCVCTRAHARLCVPGPDVTSFQGFVTIIDAFKPSQTSNPK